MLQRAYWVASIQVLRCNDVLVVPTESCAAVFPTAGQIIPAVQRPLAVELVGNYGAFVKLPVLLCPVACGFYPLTRHVFGLALIHSLMFLDVAGDDIRHLGSQQRGSATDHVKWFVQVTL